LKNVFLTGTLVYSAFVKVCLSLDKANSRVNLVSRLILEYGPISGHVMKSYKTLIQE